MKFPKKEKKKLHLNKHTNRSRMFVERKVFAHVFYMQIIKVKAKNFYNKSNAALGVRNPKLLSN